jgi:hypothetical protein
MRKYFPPLRIHTWGGLGSQLFAVSLAEEISHKYPKRKIVLILHSSGVTRRSPEIRALFPEFDYREIDDFVSREKHDSKFHGPKWPLKNRCLAIIKKLAIFFGILAIENESNSHPIKKWTISVRGHYSYRNISTDFICLLINRLERVTSSANFDFSENTIIHYRLGDLLELSNKRAIEPSRITAVLSSQRPTSTFTIFSDSPETAISLLSNRDGRFNFVAGNLDAIGTIWAASTGKVFIGTSSKISYWVILLRSRKSDASSNFMPEGDSVILQKLGSDISKMKFY